jgi:hypothetical protein
MLGRWDAGRRPGRAAWNQGAREYTGRLDDAIQFLRAGRGNLQSVERADLGDLRTWCRSAVHLQCASGKDTLSLLIYSLLARRPAT